MVCLWMICIQLKIGCGLLRFVQLGESSFEICLVVSFFSSGSSEVMILLKQVLLQCIVFFRFFMIGLVMCFCVRYWLMVMIWKGCFFMLNGMFLLLSLFSMWMMVFQVLGLCLLMYFWVYLMNNVSMFMMWWRICWQFGWIFSVCSVWVMMLMNCQVNLWNVVLLFLLESWLVMWVVILEIWLNWLMVLQCVDRLG